MALWKESNYKVAKKTLKLFPQERDPRKDKVGKGAPPQSFRLGAAASSPGCCPLTCSQSPGEKEANLVGTGGPRGGVTPGECSIRTWGALVPNP